MQRQQHPKLRQLQVQNRSATSDDTENTLVPSCVSNHVAPSPEKTESVKEISDRPSLKEKVEPLRLTVDTQEKTEEETQKVKGQEPPMSAGLSNNKRYQLAMMYSNRNSQDEATVNCPTRKISSSLQSNDTISNRIDLLNNGTKEDIEDEGLTMVVPKDIEVVAGTVQSVQEKLQSPQAVSSGDQTKPTGPTGDTTGAISQAKHGLKSVNILMKQPDAAVTNKAGTLSPEDQQDAQWEEILRQNNRELRVNAWDFTDLSSKDDQNVFTIKSICEVEGIVPPPPPPPMLGGVPAPPPAPPMMPPGHYGTLPPPPSSDANINQRWLQYVPTQKEEDGAVVLEGDTP